MAQANGLAAPSVPEASPPLSVKPEPLQETFSGVAGRIEAVGTVSPTLNKDMIVEALQYRMAATEAESARHVQIISSMHNWAAQTTTSLRQVQEKCEIAELKAQAAEKKVEDLKQQLTLVVAQMQSLAQAVSPPKPPAPPTGATDDAVHGKRRRRDGLPRVDTLGSLNGLQGNGGSDQHNNCDEDN